MVFRQETGPVPVNDIHTGFLLRANIEIVEHHDPLVLNVIQRPHPGLSAGGLLSGAGQIAAKAERGQQRQSQKSRRQ